MKLTTLPGNIFYLTIFFSLWNLHTVKGQDIYANVLKNSSPDLHNPGNIVNGNDTDFAYLDSSSVLSNSYVEVDFPVSGEAGDVVNVILQQKNGSLNAGVTNSVTMRLYDSAGNNVANASADSMLPLSLISPATHTYAMRFFTNPVENYRFKTARIEFNNTLALNSINELRIYSVYYQKTCPAVVATSVYAYGTNGLVTGYVTNPNNAVDAPLTNYATLTVPLDLLSLLPPAYLDLKFSQDGYAGDYAGFAISQASSSLSTGVLSNLTIEAYDDAGVLRSAKTGFTTTDLKLIDTSTPSYLYTIGFVTQPGNYRIARLKIILHAHIGLLEDVNVYYTYHYTINRMQVVITSSSGSLALCGPGTSVTLTAFDSLGSTNFLWSNGATTPSITVSDPGRYSVQVTDELSCTRYSAPVVVYEGAATHAMITGDTLVACMGTITGTLHTTQTYAHYVWSNGDTTATIPISDVGQYYVTVKDNDGCTGSDTVNVQRNDLHITANINGVSCAEANNGAIALIVSNGSGNYSYLWSTGATSANITGLAEDAYTAIIKDITSGCTYNRMFTVSIQNAMDIKTTVINTSGIAQSDGRISVEVVGGSGNFSYLWSNGATSAAISGLKAGWYTLAVTDNSTGCKLYDTLIVSDNNSGLVITYSVTEPTACNVANGAISLTVTGGSGSYSYLWSNGATTPNIANLSAGIYYVLVRDNNTGAGKSISIQLYNTNMLDIAGTVTPTNCNSNTGAITITVSNGSGAYNYLWSNGATTSSIANLAVGMYMVTVTDNNTGCVGKAVYNITELTGPAATLTATMPGNGSETNGSISINIAGDHYTYLWSTGATTKSISGLPAGTYSVIITDLYTGCRSVYIITLHNHPQINIFANVNRNHNCVPPFDGSLSVSVSGNTGPLTYSLNNSPVGNPVTGLGSGNYIYTVSDGSYSNSVSFSIDPVNCDSTIVIHNVITPNGDGVNDVLVIEGSEYYPDNDLKIFDKWGDVVYEKQHYDNKWGGTDKKSNPLPMGTYYYLLKINIKGKEESYTGFVMIQR